MPDFPAFMFNATSSKAGFDTLQLGWKIGIDRAANRLADLWNEVLPNDEVVVSFMVTQFLLTKIGAKVGQLYGWPGCFAINRQALFRGMLTLSCRTISAS